MDDDVQKLIAALDRLIRACDAGPDTSPWEHMLALGSARELVERIKNEARTKVEVPQPLA